MDKNIQFDDLAKEEQELLVLAMENNFFMQEKSEEPYISTVSGKRFYDKQDPAYAKKYLLSFQLLIEKMLINKSAHSYYYLTDIGFEVVFKKYPNLLKNCYDGSLMAYANVLIESSRFDDARAVYNKIIKQLSELISAGNLKDEYADIIPDDLDNTFSSLEVLESKLKNWEKVIEICEKHKKITNSEIRKAYLDESIKKAKKKLNPKFQSSSTERILENCLKIIPQNKISSDTQKWNLKIENNFPEWAKKPLVELQPPLPKFKSTYTRDGMNLVEHLSEETKKYYTMWLEGFKNQKPLKLYNNYSYLRYHIDQYCDVGCGLSFELDVDELTGRMKRKKKEIDKIKNKKIREELELLIFLYINEPFPSITGLVSYMFYMVIRLYLDEKRENNAIAWWNSNSALLYKHRYPTSLRETILNLKYQNNFPLNGADFLLLLNPSDSQYLAKNIKLNYLKVIKYLDEKIRAFEAEHRVDLLKIITVKYALKAVYGGYTYKALGDFQQVVKDWIKEALKAARKS